MRLSLKLAWPSDVNGPKIRQAFQLGWLAGAHRHDEQASRLPAPQVISLSDSPGMDAAASAGRPGQSCGMPMHPG